MNRIQVLMLIAVSTCLILLLWFGIVRAESGVVVYDIIDRVTYFVTTDKEIPITWSHGDPIPDFYQVRIYHFEQKRESYVGQTTENVMTTKLPRAGHFIFKVRSCIGENFSEWSESIDPENANVNGEPRAWWFYGYTAPPGPITVE